VARRRMRICTDNFEETRMMTDVHGSFFTRHGWPRVSTDHLYQDWDFRTRDHLSTPRPCRLPQAHYIERRRPTRRHAGQYQLAYRPATVPSGVDRSPRRHRPQLQAASRLANRIQV